MSEQGMKDRVMLCTDLDGTLVGDDEAMHEVLERVSAEGIVLAFSTGRTVGQVEELVEEASIEPPEAAMCLVGTEVYFVLDGELVLDPRWAEAISRGWDREVLDEVLKDMKELEPQEEQWQTDFKRSYYLREDHSQVVNEIRRRVQEASLAARIVYSGGQFLDIIPARSGKARATAYAAYRLGIEPESVIVCGDSGNDLAMFEAGFRGIIVGNAEEELQEFSGDNAYHAEADHGAGIIEGLEHFDIL